MEIDVSPGVAFHSAKLRENLNTPVYMELCYCLVMADIMLHTYSVNDLVLVCSRDPTGMEY